MKNSSEEDKSGRPGQAGRQQRQPPAEAQGQEQRPPDEEARAPGGREDEDVADHAAALGVASRQPLNGHHQNGYTATSKPCCRENEMKNAQLTEENVLLQTKLKSANKDLALKVNRLNTFLILNFEIWIIYIGRRAFSKNIAAGQILQFIPQ